MATTPTLPAPLFPLIEQLKLVAETYRHETGLEVTTLSCRVFVDSGKLRKILDGSAGITTRRFESAMLWFSENWPDGIDWPSDVPRPARAASEPCA